VALLVTAPTLRARAAELGPQLDALRASLGAELDSAAARAPLVPRFKAIMTRAGGRCPNDGVLLEFDPFSPSEHRCGRCGLLFTGEYHDRWWAMSQQLWLAERSVIGALLHSLGGEERHASFAESILSQFADAYLDYPNSDNVLGPTRPFFSTYLESIWLLQICVALDFLELAGRETPLGTRVRKRVVEPSAAIISSYDEGMSNRQAWNSAALMAAAATLGDHDTLERRATRALDLMERALLADGSWFEGENYHVFAHRALWYVASICSTHGRELPRTLRQRYVDGFAIPFRTALPDMTMLARRDSQYGVSLRQWRFAELCELGLAESTETGLNGVLSRCYSHDLPEGDSGRSSSTAEVDRHQSPVRLDRSSLGWKSLLRALPVLPGAGADGLLMERVHVLRSQGLAVFRRQEGRVMAALDYGHHGGGHGHPDRLNLNLQRGAAGWLMDPGTGSYVDPSLFWYRSSLAHNAPMCDWRAQSRNHGYLVAEGGSDADDWVVGEFEDGISRIRYRRAVQVRDDWILDVLEWRAEWPCRVQLPLHLNPESVELAGDAASGSSPAVEQRTDLLSSLQSAPLPANPGVDAGVGFISAARRAEVPAGSMLRVHSRQGGEQLVTWIRAQGAVTLWVMHGPGVPYGPDRAFMVVETAGVDAGRMAIAHQWSRIAGSVRIDEELVELRFPDGSREVHALPVIDPLSFRADVDGAGGARTSAGAAARVESARLITAASERVPLSEIAAAPGALSFFLGEAHFRRSELDWVAHGEPTAVVTLAADRDSFLIHAAVRVAYPQISAPLDAAWLDNELPDVNSSGIQIHLSGSELAQREPAAAAVLVVPQAAQMEARVTAPGDDWRNALTECESRLDDAGFTVAVSLKREAIATAGASVFGVDVLANLLAPGRVRRSGQLVLTGAGGEWTWLQGDRQHPERHLKVRIADE
jgi:hypothetical protein